ncbi:probable Golgi apparatus membrane protein TVP23 [Zygosaccharomyces bailii]|uniref:Golgi apparatus membrane protein TVP23 n=1 Tax=Zygosaccharomyces bailii (strain CLIB 213 / ATCC 58445 / CBS 680 / BCRC 21525 / NBRC 1098 / NCYC 1416 / NRRL Y-2227) TaxID=1333698 RepID=A0A8J2WX71_ZYGB2|nr:BN860_12090g1_1 [Zygosaccharomyces bailii CLIB 213]CDH14605.1 probable Golgi apparatus membrane protein TVP23 [Zygosaccharomyces bailii ISA1307]SJM82246.1 probable Golgi apparatus membrane protein TVP23 [Zygosaccharomyces bailii]
MALKEHINNFYQTILKSSHPLLLSIHLAGKLAPILFYVLGSLFMGFTPHFIVVVLLLAGDFYLTKNISGRKLVQLRWWYDPSSEGFRAFIFESYKQYAPGPPINPIDSKLFWWSMYLTPLVWGVFAFLCVIRFKLFYLLLVVVGLVLTSWNTYGFHCCERWDPNQDENGNNSWFQMPSLPGLDNLYRLASIQSFFRPRS